MKIPLPTVAATSLGVSLELVAHTEATHPTSALDSDVAIGILLWCLRDSVLYMIWGAVYLSVFARILA